ncbi:hypothetical protein HNR06_000723 [Nocardiopsis arvandica]|uniref:DUF2637 domain-containing protein n=1 Tax=Nocardiopsis sinuspersici TaxID=501010 RepID=A0A7Y9X8S3_9ACTN|nr:DUF2637 domain-containing protein [Nocardiopsis sinuspersici]NYH51134.1 hypothetical protein [Nocardiopsis sinuspersici]
MSESLPLPLWSLIAAAALAVTVLAVWGMRRLASRRPARVRGDSGAAPLHGGYLVATAVIAVVALALILVAFTMSYAALYEAATWLARTQLDAINGGDLRFLFPLGIDAVIVYFLAMDLLMEWQGRRHPLNRWAAYALSAITIILNVSQGDGSTASYLGHAGPPIVIILIAEGVAAWVRHLAGIAHGQSADRIPVGRWIAHPLSTMKVARLMLGWGITSYPQALEREQRRQLAYAMLREQHGRTWRRHTPRHLRWMLNNGYDLDTAYELTRAMTAHAVAMTAAEVAALAGGTGRRPTAPAHTERERADTTGRERAETSGTASSRTRAASRARGTHSSSTPRASRVEETPPAEPLAPAQKRQRVRELMRSFPGITDSELARYINASPSTARRYRNEITHQRLGVDIPGHTPGQDQARRDDEGERRDDEGEQREGAPPALATARPEH